MEAQSDTFLYHIDMPFVNYLKALWGGFLIAYMVRGDQNL